MMTVPKLAVAVLLLAEETYSQPRTVQAEEGPHPCHQMEGSVLPRAQSTVLTLPFPTSSNVKR